MDVTHLKTHVTVSVSDVLLNIFGMTFDFVSFKLNSQSKSRPLVSVPQSFVTVVGLYYNLSCRLRSRSCLVL